MNQFFVTLYFDNGKQGHGIYRGEESNSGEVAEKLMGQKGDAFITINSRIPGEALSYRADKISAIKVLQEGEK